MELINSPDFYINYRKAQFKTPIEVLKKNFKNLQKLIEKNNQAVNKYYAKLKSMTSAKDKIKLVNKLIESQQLFQRKLKVRVTQHIEFVNRLVTRIVRLNNVNDLYTKYAGVAIKNYDHIPADLREFYQTENNILVIEYLLRQYNPNETPDTANPGIQLLNRLELSKHIDYDIIQQGLRIHDEIVNKKNLKLLKQWCIENKKNLAIIKDTNPTLIKSDVEFECDFQEFMEMINIKEYAKAIMYARKHLSNSELLDRMEKLNAGSSLIWTNFVAASLDKAKTPINEGDDIDPLIYYSSTRQKTRKSLDVLKSITGKLSQDTWNELGDFFSLNFRLLYGMNQIPPIDTMLNLGGSVLKTRSCHFYELSNGYTDYTKAGRKCDDTQCPVCSVELNHMITPLPYSLHHRSNLYDDPVMLPNGNVYSYSQLMFFNRSKFGSQYPSPEDTIDGIVNNEGRLTLSKFTKQNLVFPDYTKFKIDIADPITNESFLVSSLEKVFPT